MKILKSRILLVIITIILTGSISVYAARKYYASDVHYKDTTLDKVLDTLYTTQNTTVNNLNSQITNLQSQISSLNEQITELNKFDECVSSSFKCTTCNTTSGQTIANLSFKPSAFIYTIKSQNVFGYYNVLYDSNMIYQISDGSTLIRDNSSIYLSMNNELKIMNFAVPTGEIIHYIACK